MLSVLFSIIAIIVVMVLLFFLGVGLMVMLAGISFIVVFAMLFSFCTGNEDGILFQSSQISVIGQDAHSELPQQWNECLLKAVASECREKFTTWDEKQLDTVEQFISQTKKELGPRLQDTEREGEFKSQEGNGEGKQEIRVTVDYQQKKAVKEHFKLKKIGEDWKIDEVSLSF